ncbi:MAG: AAA family ATPase, partial [Zoogloea sp.]|nr:AAA family ATPase [Zoogloea sp.]
VAVVGQEQALDALRFALEVRHAGHNAFVLGEPGSGRHAAVRQVLEEQARGRAAAPDLCYVHDFREPMRPRVLYLPAGRGMQLRRDMKEFVGEMGAAISSMVENDEFRSRIEALQEEYKEREEHALRDLGRASGEQGIALLRTPQGFVFVPAKGEETMDSNEFARLPDEEKQRIAKVTEEYGALLQKLMHQFPRWRRELQGRIKQATRDTISLAVGHLIEDLKASYADLPEVQRFLDEVLQDVIESGEAQQGGESEEDDGSGTTTASRYQVNLLVDHAGAESAPVVFEDHPSFQNLVGRLDQIARMGTLATNFSLIRAGALHRANGGYLMLDAAKILSQPYAWEGLKRELKAGRIHIESLGQVLGWAASLPLEPEAVELDVKVVLFGERVLYYLLKEHDPEFDELFKVAADFESRFERSAANVQDYARHLARLARERGLLPLERAAVARLIEHGARLADDAEQLSALIRPVEDLMLAADHLAQRAGRDRILREDVESALADRVRRAGRVHRQLLQEILRNTLLISTDGGHVGQINGLAVIDMGDFRFAHPMRITATVRIGDGHVIDIERESELGGALHSKGVLILSAFLAARYSHNIPLSLAASLVFEQSYGPVEGDSASLAELCALLSALADVPIRQSLAVTGSVNQYGEVQAIGGVNEKIEGFFDICQARGLTGEQGVVIPASNMKHLMLREEVVAAAAEGKFHVYAVEDVDEAIEILTGIPAGEPDDDGIVPADTINFLVATELLELSSLRQEYGGRRKTKRAAAKAES